MTQLNDKLINSLNKIVKRCDFIFLARQRDINVNFSIFTVSNFSIHIQNYTNFAEKSLLKGKIFLSPFYFHIIKLFPVILFKKSLARNIEVLIDCCGKSFSISLYMDFVFSIFAINVWKNNFFMVLMESFVIYKSEFHKTNNSIKTK